MIDVLQTIAIVILAITSGLNSTTLRRLTERDR